MPHSHSERQEMPPVVAFKWLELTHKSWRSNISDLISHLQWTSLGLGLVEQCDQAKQSLSGKIKMIASIRMLRVSR